MTAGCTKTESGKTPVARLDNTTLALEEIRAHIDTSYEPSQAQVQQYIQRWLTEESLYREAVERGLDRSDEINQKVEDVRRQLTINAMLDKEVYSQQLSNFSPQDIRQYYDAHIKEFDLVSYVLFKNRDAATEFRNLVLKGTTWSSALVRHESTLLMHADSSYQTQATFIPAELWRVAAKAAIHEPSFPINTDNGYYILVVWNFFKQGQTAELPMVEQEIRGRLTVERRRKLFDQLIQNLRARHSIEVFVNSTSDSGKLKIEE
jgi:peptidyl-prolyl cis-trans isomerase C